ncbi:MAG: hypothetical protein VXX85_07985 [Candidatus Margulisiibacteriota bacterium]|nr:hypothetical protein [Candidatus Margulisiibacteriota bacterium]
MRKFTLYQAARYTKISRYKLEQAIEDGLLTCIEGKGNVKCYIPEESLNDFIEKFGEQYRRFTYPEEKNQTYVSDEINQFISKEFHDQILNEKDRVISLLEFQNQQLIPLAERTKSEMTVKMNELKSIALSAINELPHAKSDLRSKLNNQLESF